MSAFTGREAELAELDRLLPAAEDEAPGPVMISAVSGTAGVGKTALAVRWAHRAAGAFPDGQLYVNLRGYDPDQPLTAGEALAGFLRALGVPSQDIPLGEAERAARYRSLAADRRLLVVLDNAATVEQVRPLLPGTPSVMVLVTSRDALTGLVARDGARRLDLDMLPAAEAVMLLGALIGERAAADPVAVRTLAELCVRLPLALRVAAELAVARPETPMAALAAELAGEGERLELLNAGGDPRGAVANVFSWSYRHLTADAARLFRLLGLHPGPDWDRYAAAALTGTDVGQAGRLLDSLVRAHLIQPSGPTRYGMHDLLRAYAAQLAATEDENQGREAMASMFDYYLAACAAAMDGLAPAGRDRRPSSPPSAVPVPALEDRTVARAWLDAELAALTTIAAYTASHGWSGYSIRLAATLRRYLYGHDAEAFIVHSHALESARSCNDRAAQADALTSLGALHTNQGRYQEAVVCYQQALTLARDIGDHRARARALGNLGIIHARQANYQLAADHMNEALTFHRELGDELDEAIDLTNLGNVYGRLGHYDQAADHHRQALNLYRKLGDQLGGAIALTNLGEVCYCRGRYQEAIDHQLQALALSRESGDLNNQAEQLTRLGQVCHRQGHYDQAAEYYQQALALRRDVGDRDGEADALNGAGETLLATGQPAQAHTCHIRALTLTSDTGNRSEQARAMARLATVCRKQGNYQRAAEYDQQALSIYREIGDPAGEADTLNGAGETSLATGQSAQACDLHIAALILARRTGDRFQEARAHYGVASACQATAQPDRARQHWQHALDIYTDLGVPEASQMKTTPALSDSPAAPTTA